MDDNLLALLEIIKQTNATYLRQLLRQVSRDELQPFYTHFRVSTIDELIAILHCNASVLPNNCTTSDHGEKQSATTAATTLMLILPAIIILVGTAGNLLTFLILITDRTMRTVSTYFYLAVLALADTFVLYMGLMTLWISFLIGHDVRVESTWFCKANNALGHTVSDFSVWLLVAVTCERFVVVCFPLHASAICRRSAARFVVLILLSVLCAINFHLFITADVTANRNKNDTIALANDSDDDGGSRVTKMRCGGGYGFEFLVEKVWPWVDAVLYSLLPFIIIATLNAFIVSQVMAAKRRRQQLCSAGGAGRGGGSVKHGSSSGRNNRSHAKSLRSQKLSSSSLNSAASVSAVPATITTMTEHGTPSRALTSSGWVGTTTAASSSDGDSMRLTIMLLAVTFTFLITTLPIIVVNIASMALHTLHDDQQIAMYALARRICELLMYANHSINFFLYCATGQKFRHQLVVLLCWLCCRRARRYTVVGRQGTTYAGTTVTTCIDHCSPRSPSSDHDDVVDRATTRVAPLRSTHQYQRGQNARTRAAAASGRHQRLSNDKL